MNRHDVIGNLGKAPEYRTLDGGKAVCRFSLATAYSYKDRNGNKVDETDWHNIVMFGPLADVANRYLAKGSRVFISGRSVTRSYEKDGQTRYTTEIVVRDMEFLGSKPENITPPAEREAPSQYGPSDQPSGDDDDLPF